MIMKKTVLITGATGYLGQVVTRDLIESRKYNVHLLLEDINDYESISKHIPMCPVDVVIHMAALVASYKGDERDLAQTNYLATRKLLQYLPFDVHFIFLSTECVFKSDPNMCWDINDIKEPETAYGTSKSNAEDFLLRQSNINKISILRTSMLYGYDKPERKNFLRFLYECVENQAEVEVFTDVYNRPTHVSDLSAFILDVIEKETTGIIHAASEDYVNRYELSKMFCDAYGYSHDLLIPVTQPIAGRMPTQLNLKPSEIFTKQVKFPLREGITTCLKKINNIGE